MIEQQNERYEDIIYKLKMINNKLINYNNNIKSLQSIIEKNILINDECFKIKDINTINNMLRNVSYSISNNIIPSLNRKIK